MWARFAPRLTSSIRLGGRMDITGVKIFPIEEEKGDCFVVRDLEGVARKRKDGASNDVAQPLNAQTRERFEKLVLAEYAKVAASVRPTLKHSK